MAKRPLSKTPGVPAPPAGDASSPPKTTRARKTKASATVSAPVDSATDNPSTIASEMPAPDRILSGGSDTTPAVAMAAASEGGPTADEIREAAYHRFLARGGHQGGSELDDWLEAERELRRR